MTSHISTTILNRLPSIPRQHAIVFGNSIQIPTLFKVNDSDPPLIVVIMILLITGLN